MTALRSALRRRMPSSSSASLRSSGAGAAAGLPTTVRGLDGWVIDHFGGTRGRHVSDEAVARFVPRYASADATRGVARGVTCLAAPGRRAALAAATPARGTVAIEGACDKVPARPNLPDT